MKAFKIVSVFVFYIIVQPKKKLGILVLNTLLNTNIIILNYVLEQSDTKHMAF